MSSISYAAAATTYGHNSSDAFYELSQPGVVRGPLEINGNLTVDGTTTLVGPMTAQGGLTSTGGVFSGPPGLPLTFGVDTLGNVSAKTYNGLSQLGVTSVINLVANNITYTWTGSQIVALDSNQIVTLQLPPDILTNTSYPQGLLFTRIHPGVQGVQHAGQGPIHSGLQHLPRRGPSDPCRVSRHNQHWSPSDLLCTDEQRRRHCGCG